LKLFSKLFYQWFSGIELNELIFWITDSLEEGKNESFFVSFLALVNRDNIYEI
jgi:hypothetical protein